jgi:cysteinyl-tRNA synthetase
MSLRIFNSLTREQEPFSPLEAGHVRMYVCGMTIYDLCHIGHARMMMAFDVVQRWLKSSGYRVTYVRNITDIDDKIIRRAVERGITIRALTDEMIAAMHHDIGLLGIEPPSLEPRATEYVRPMLDLIGQLEARGLAYKSSSGDVNYSVRKFPGYGKLSGKSLDELRAGERVAVQDGKDDPLDFVLWKAAKESEPQDAKWDSKALGHDYGVGRPAGTLSARP